MEYPIRILNLFTVMNRGGAETLVMNLYRNIDRNKIQFDFLVHRKERGVFDDEIEQMGGRIYRMSPISPKHMFQYFKELSLFFKEHHGEYRIIHSHMSEMGYFVFREAKKYNIPIRILHAHNAPNSLYGTFLIRFKRFFRIYFAREMCKMATDYFTCSNVAAAWLFKSKPGVKVHFLKNAVDTSLFSYNEKKSHDLKRKMGVENLFVIGHVANFSLAKNHAYLIDIFFDFHKKHPDSVLWLVGSGQLRGEIESKVKRYGIQNSVKFWGNRSDVKDLMQVFDVFVFPSLYEGLPVSLVEAQAAGLPCIVSANIAPETKIIEDYIPISITQPAECWIPVIEKYLDFERKDTSDIMKKTGFDIVSCAESLSNFYLERITSIYS